jgi:2-oxoglutarate dehydrogenase E1 component
VLVASRLATLYREKFGKDVVLDLWGFRKHGHNEVDEPRVTNVSLYQQVDRRQPVAHVFAATMTGTLRQQCQQLQERIEDEYRAPFIHDTHCEKQPLGNSSITRDESKWVDFWLTLARLTVTPVLDCKS